MAKWHSQRLTKQNAVTVEEDQHPSFYKLSLKEFHKIILEILLWLHLDEPAL